MSDVRDVSDDGLSLNPSASVEADEPAPVPIEA
jgi:hypothetical protein